MQKGIQHMRSSRSGKRAVTDSSGVRRGAGFLEEAQHRHPVTKLKQRRSELVHANRSHDARGSRAVANPVALNASANVLVSRSSATIYTPSEMQEMMGLGINLGNRYDLWNEAGWANGNIPKTVTEDMFDEYQANGFTNVRIPVCWHWKTGESAPYDIDSDFMAEVEQMVDWSLDRGMVTILDTHHEEWLDDEAAFSGGLERFKAIWTQIADRFKDKDHMLLFEIVNEPHLITIDQLNELYDEVFPIIRDSNPTRIVLMQGLSYGNPEWIVNNPTSLTIPDDDYIMLAFHRYDPWAYAGLSPTQTSWTYDDDFATMTSWMDDIDSWSTTYNVSLYYGEFGVTNDQTADRGRDDWFTAHATEIASRGWGASVWNDGSGHLIFDYDDLSWVDDILWDLSKSKRCCWGGELTCGTVTTCKSVEDASFCSASWNNCVNSCSGKWCTNEKNGLSA